MRAVADLRVERVVRPAVLEAGRDDVDVAVQQQRPAAAGAGEARGELRPAGEADALRRRQRVARRRRREPAPRRRRRRRSRRRRSPRYACSAASCRAGDVGFLAALGVEPDQVAGERDDLVAAGGDLVGEGALGGRRAGSRRAGQSSWRRAYQAGRPPRGAVTRVGPVRFRRLTWGQTPKPRQIWGLTAELLGARDRARMHRGSRGDHVPIRSSVMNSVLPSGSRKKNIGGTGSPIRDDLRVDVDAGGLQGRVVGLDVGRLEARCRCRRRRACPRAAARSRASSRRRPAPPRATCTPAT